MSFTEDYPIVTDPQAETTNVLRRVRDERDAQDAKWGQQDHPIIQPGYTYLTAGRYAQQAREFQRLNDFRQAEGLPASSDSILLEEVYEALGETDEVKREAELVQVAAVAVKMVEASRRKRRNAQDLREVYAAFRQKYATGINPAYMELHVAPYQPRALAHYAVSRDGVVTSLVQ